MSEVQAFGKLKALYDKMPAKEISWGEKMSCLLNAARIVADINKERN